MRKSKKILSIILTVLMILSVIPFAGLTAFAEDSDFIIDENGVLTGYTGSGGSICLPETVTEIKYNAFMNNNSITEVTIPGNIKTIGERAFEGCSNLQKVTMLEGVENLGQYLFWYCEKLETVILPDSIKDMGENCLFAGCSSIKSITLPKGIKTVGFAAFSGCASLSEIILPEGLETIGSDAFWQTSLESIVIPSSVKNIGTTAFDNYSCKTFKSITFYTDKVKFEDNAFYGFNKDINFYCACNLDLESLQSKLTAANFKGTGEYLPHQIENGFCTICGCECEHNIIDGVCTICGANEFVIDSDGVLTDYNGNSADVVIPDNVTAIGANAFKDNKYISNVTIHDDITSIGDSAFEGCTGLTSVEISDDVSSIGNSAFRNCSSLTGVVIPDGITAIKGGTFDGCSSLTSLTIPDSVTSIGNYSIRFCSKLTSVVIPDSVTSLGTQAFFQCTGLKEITIPGGVTSIGDRAFEGCTSLSKVYTCNVNNIKPMMSTFGNYEYVKLDHNIVDGFCTVCGGECEHNIIDGVCTICGADEFEIDSNGVLTKYRGQSADVVIPDGVKAIGASVFIGNKNIKNVTIPDSVIRIGNSAFKDCTSLTGAVIPDGVTAIEGGTFDGCSSLTSLIIPDSVTSIGNYSIRFCKKLTSVVLPDSVTSLGTQAFFQCTGLKEITIPGGVTSIGGRAFEGCTSLSKVYTCNVESISAMMSTFGTYEYVELDHNLVRGVCKVCGYCEFEIDSNGVLTGYYGEIPEVVIPDDVTAIGENAFTDTPWISSVIIPDSVTSIGNNAFEGCECIESITIPASVTSIGSKVFNGCIYLSSITVDPDNTVFDSRNNCNAIIETATNKLICGCASTVIPDSVTAIGDYAFYNCESLTRIAIPLSVTSVGTDAFANTGLEIIEFRTCGDISGLMENSGAYGAYFLKRNHSFVEGVCTVCGFKCYHRFDEMEGDGICLECGCTCKHEYVDYVCIICGYREFEVNSNGVITKYIGKGGKVVIPDGITAIGENAFADNTSLTEIVISDSVTSIGNNAFNGCNNLTDAYFLGTEARWNAVTIGSNNDPLINAGVKCTIVSAEPFIDEADFETLKTESGAKIISGFNPGDTTNALDVYLNNGWDVSIKTADGTNRIGTGSVITLTSLKGDLTEYTVVIYGDTDGDAWYDGMDSTYVNVLANGLLTKEDVSEAVWYASDCNHDGIVDENDVALLEQAGLLLANIDQTKSGSSLTEDSVFVEYLSLISQKTAANEAPAEEAQADTTPADEPVAAKTLIQKIIDFIIYIFNLITSYISKVF